MKKIQVKFANQIVELLCSDTDKVSKLAAKINERIDVIRNNNPNYSLLQLSFFVALTLQKEVDDLQDKLDSQIDKENTILDSNQSQQIRIDELYNILENLTSFLEDTASKLEDM